MTFQPTAFIHAHNFEPRSVLGFAMMVCSICGVNQASAQQNLGGWGKPQP